MKGRTGPVLCSTTKYTLDCLVFPKRCHLTPLSLTTNLVAFGGGLTTTADYLQCLFTLMPSPISEKDRLEKNGLHKNSLLSEGMYRRLRRLRKTVHSAAKWRHKYTVQQHSEAIQLLIRPTEEPTMYNSHRKDKRVENRMRWEQICTEVAFVIPFEI